MMYKYPGRGKGERSLAGLRAAAFQSCLYPLFPRTYIHARGEPWLRSQTSMEFVLSYTIYNWFRQLRLVSQEMFRVLDARLFMGCSAVQACLEIM